VNHVIVVDLGYGDAGKGTVVDWLCARQEGRPVRGLTSADRPAGVCLQGPVHAVVRFNGGAQAAHNVITRDGRHHTFAQFGAGTFTPGVRTHLSRFVLLDPLALAAEAAHLASLGLPEPLDLLTVDRDALLTTPYHQAANRARETARGNGRHGSCGMGIGETARYALENPDDAPRAGDCASPRTLARKLANLRDRLTDELGQLTAPPLADMADAFWAFAAKVRLVDSTHLTDLLRTGPVVFEGAQGVLLDEWRGFHPYTTWSTTTFANADQLLAEAGQQAIRLGVTRCYATRHGPGPLVTEDPTLNLPEPHNGRGTWQGPFRTGHLDTVALRYAIEVAGGVDALALTHLDTAAAHPELRACNAYHADGRTLTHLNPGPPRDLTYQQQLTDLLLAARPIYENPGTGWADLIEQEAGAPVLVHSYGPTIADKLLGERFAPALTTASRA
jgi:adenylosuccinate synthase